MRLGPSAAKAFWAKVDRGAADECWNWRGYLHPKTGYGMFGWNYGKYYAHRFVVMLREGTNLNGKYVLHSCDNRKCVNPAHLRLGTQKDNMDDMYARGRNFHQRGSKHGLAKLTEEAALEIYHDKRTHAVIAKDHGVGETAVRSIKKGRTWSHVTGAEKWSGTSQKTEI